MLPRCRSASSRHPVHCSRDAGRAVGPTSRRTFPSRECCRALPVAVHGGRTRSSVAAGSAGALSVSSSARSSARESVAIRVFGALAARRQRSTRASARPARADRARRAPRRESRPDSRRAHDTSAQRERQTIGGAAGLFRAAPPFGCPPARSSRRTRDLERVRRLPGGPPTTPFAPDPGSRSRGTWSALAGGRPRGRAASTATGCTPPRSTTAYRIVQGAQTRSAAPSRHGRRAPSTGLGSDFVDDGQARSRGTGRGIVGIASALALFGGSSRPVPHLLRLRCTPGSRSRSP